MLGVGSNPDSRDAAWNWPGDHEAASWRLLLASVGVPVSDSPSPQASRWSLELRSMTVRSPGSQSVSQTVLFLAAFPLPGRAFVGNRARRCAPRIDPRSQPLTRNPGKSNAAGNRAHPCLQGPRAIQDTAHRTATCHRRQESAGLLFFLLELEAISTFVGLFPTKRQETGQAPWLHQGNRRTGSATPPAKDGSIPLRKDTELCVPRGLCSPSGSCRERK